MWELVRIVLVGIAGSALVSTLGGVIAYLYERWRERRHEP